MRRLASILVSLLIVVSYSFAQKLEPKKPELDDFISLLSRKGFEVLPFDISSLSDSRLNISFSIREYENGQKVRDNILPWSPTFSNMMMLSDFNEDSRKEIHPEDMDCPDRGIYRLSDKVTVGLTPENDSVKTVELSIDKMGSIAWKLPLKGQPDHRTGARYFNYTARPFVMGPKIEFNAFTPLVLVGSAWFDPDAELYRFCGENEISPDLSSRIISRIPHFYVIGITVTPADDKK